MYGGGGKSEDIGDYIEWDIRMWGKFKTSHYFQGVKVYITFQNFF